MADLSRRRRCAIAAGALALAGVAAAAEQPPGFRVVKPDLDLGRMISGSTVTATFEFVNDTDRDVRILRAAPS